MLTVSQRIVKWVMKFSVFAKDTELIEPFLTVSTFLRVSKCGNSFVFLLIRVNREQREVMVN